MIDHGEFTTNKIAGPARWTAPEILDPPEEDDAEPQYSFSSDIFAFGMTAVEVCSFSYGHCNQMTKQFIDLDFDWETAVQQDTQ